MITCDGAGASHALIKHLSYSSDYPNEPGITAR